MAMLEWRGDRLCLKGGGKSAPQVSIVQDEKYSSMYRVRYPDGRLSDMVNRARARDAAKSILLDVLNATQTAAGGG